MGRSSFGRPSFCPALASSGVCIPLSRRFPAQTPGHFQRAGVRGEPTWQLHVRGFNRAFALLLDFYAGEALGVVP